MGADRVLSSANETLNWGFAPFRGGMLSLLKTR